MSEGLPKVAAKIPAVLEVQPGTCYWCTCGLSGKQPFCDGAHKGSGMVPLKVEVAEAGTKAFCLCKQSKTPPYCDGSHCAL